MAMEMMSEERILCATCGIAIAPNPANMCLNCIRADVDITEGIPKQATVHFCRGCDRYPSTLTKVFHSLNKAPPNVWVTAALESRELLALCLRKLRGLSKVRLVDAGFVWTEPHSKRIKVKLTVQKEVFASTILQQVFVTEFVVAGQYCDECTRVDAQLTWKAVVQLRQKVTHKRTFLWLEQLILKHNAHKDTTNIKEFRDGLDFYYSHKAHALKMVEFLQSVVPMRMKQSQELISSDVHAGTADFKWTYSVELVPICKDDLVCLPPKVARSLSDISQLAICTRVSNMLTFLDPNTGKFSELRSMPFWEHSFSPLADKTSLVEFYVIDIQIESTTQKYAIATAEVSKSTDFSKTYMVRTHLGYILKAGDHCTGYLLANANYNNTTWDAYSTGVNQNQIADVMIVAKSYPNMRKKKRTRQWKLGKIVTETLESNRKGEKLKNEQDYEMFLRDIEEDVELRGMVNLYKAPAIQAIDEIEGASDEEPEADFPEIQMSDLMDEMEQLKIKEFDDQEI